MITVIGTPKTRTLRVLWMLEELGLPYDHVAARPRSEEVTALNPLGRIPVLRDGDAVLTDSVAIMAYLGDRSPDAGGADCVGGLSHPAGTPERARQDALTLQMVDEFDALLWTMARHTFVLPEKLRVPEVLPTCEKELVRNAARLADALGDRPFLMGAQMTIPDIMAGHCCNWAVTAGVKLDPPPPLAAYLKRLRARPAYRRAIGRPELG
ncbi:MAG: glutathione S-transferase family protein [Pseudomonadota bacterium]